ncbi:MAG: DUF2848 domain-containing protein [Micropruina sp.]|uniref:DUF2848 family protein n=1 Tax=Micropruina sp. TaxID=2737536 RepID=UPI0039E5C8BC
MARLTFALPGGGTVAVETRYALNGGYAGRDSQQVQHHIDELAELGVPGPATIPTLYPLSGTLAVQGDDVQVPHGRTSGEAEWALLVPEGATSSDDYLVTAACDHTDRALEVHGVAWSKQSAPDFLGDLAWRWGDVRDAFDSFTLRAWVTNDGVDELIQDGSPALLLSPDYWIERLGEAGLLRSGTVVMSGTIPMLPGVDQFADAWRVELAAPDGTTSRVGYTVEVLPEPWQ